MVIVGDMDPYYRVKQLDKMGNAIANAISYATEAKDKKKAALRKEFEDALELGQADPEAGRGALEALRKRTKPKLLKNALPELEPYEAMLTKRGNVEGRTERAFQKWSGAAQRRMGTLERLRAETAQMPTEIPIDPFTHGPGAYYEGMLTGNMTVPNPELSQRQQTLAQYDQDQYGLARAAMADLTPEEQIHFQKWVHEQGLSLESLMGEIDIKSLSPSVKSLMWSQQNEGEMDPEVENLIRSEAGLELTPLQQDQRRYDEGLKTLEFGRQMEKQDDAQAGRGALQSQQDKVTMERQLQSQSAAKEAAAAKSTAEAAAMDEMTFDQVLDADKRMSKAKHPTSTDSRAALKKLTKEAMDQYEAKGTPQTEGQVSQLMLQVYRDIFDETEGATLQEREIAAISKMLADMRGEDLEAEAPAAGGQHRATRRGRGGGN